MWRSTDKCVSDGEVDSATIISKWLTCWRLPGGSLPLSWCVVVVSLHQVMGTQLPGGDYGEPGMTGDQRADRVVRCGLAGAANLLSGASRFTGSHANELTVTPPRQLGIWSAELAKTRR